jgi:hypothetical protein
MAAKPCVQVSLPITLVYYWGGFSITTVPLEVYERSAPAFGLTLEKKCAEIAGIWHFSKLRPSGLVSDCSVEHIGLPQFPTRCHPIKSQRCAGEERNHPLYLSVVAKLSSPRRVHGFRLVSGPVHVSGSLGHSMVG